MPHDNLPPILTPLPIPSSSDDEERFALIEAQAAAILLAVDEDKRRDPVPPPQNIITRSLVDKLHIALSYDSNAEQEEILLRQAHSMDLSFRRLLADADIMHATGRVECLPFMYIAAFKAQEQFRRTLKQLNELQEKAERSARKEMAKKARQNKYKREKARKKPNPRKRTDNPQIFGEQK